MRILRLVLKLKICFIKAKNLLHKNRELLTGQFWKHTATQWKALTIPLSQDLWFYVASKELGILQEQ